MHRMRLAEVTTLTTNTVLKSFRLITAEQEQREDANQMYSAMILSVQLLRLRLTRSVRLAISHNSNQEREESSARRSGEMASTSARDESGAGRDEGYLYSEVGFGGEMRGIYTCECLQS
jgi:hypothetical protein